MTGTASSSPPCWTSAPSTGWTAWPSTWPTSSKPCSSGLVAPLGTCSVVAATHRDRVLTALRGTEVVADPTNAPEHAFEVDAIVRHVSIFDRLFDRLGEMDLCFPNRRAVLHGASGEEALAARVRDALRSALPDIALEEVALETPYYDGVRVLFGANDASGGFVPIGDTGRFDWVAELTSNRRLRFVASALGIQLAPLRFRATVSP